MMSFRKYLEETERRNANPVTDDHVDFIINLDTVVESIVESHTDDSITLIMDEECQAMLEHCGCEFEDGVEFAVFDEAEYQGKKVKLNDPIRTSENPKKKFKVYVKDPKSGNVKVVRFGDPKLSIKRDDPKRRKSFRARHGCDKASAKDKTKAKYWSCYQWRKGSKVNN
jgi:hypothetical protein